MKHRFSRIFLCLGTIALTASPSFAQPQAYKGWPGHDDISDLEQSFLNPPKGYGNVPFYWWPGDSLDMERLREQLEILSDASTDGLNVSYNHTHEEVEVELNAVGHGPCGRVSRGKPGVMSEEWWKIWNDFSAECAKKGIGLGMDDYVIAWPKNGEFIDSILLQPSFRDYQGLLTRDSAGVIHTEPAPWLHPDFGNQIVEKYFQPFVDHMDEEALKGMNYFFQDELQYGLQLRSWCEDMPEQFLKRKGYDIVPHLSALFVEDASLIDEETAKYRLDYAEVLTQLAEERYFKPIYDWNASKGLIYGCDPEGRGLRPLQYLDYFRAVSWFTAPGNDAPARGSSFRQTKVSSSIAHLYGRPRTWLEAFHSMGWDANGALLKRQLDHHIIAGGNLLCMHGLYYSTHGGWWEWAPPCFHFRMPYWPHMKLWLKYAERLCFLLSQGSHVCDIAVMYPTETMQAVPGTDAESTFTVSDALSTHGLDYDFIDYQSLQRSQVKDGRLNAAGESYRVLVLADTRAMHRETLEKIKEFRKAGGIVMTVGYALPAVLESGAVSVSEASSLPQAVWSAVNPDFRTGKGTGRVLHRRIGEKDVYMIMDVEKGDKVWFRSRGRAERWDAMSGKVTPLPVLETDGEGTWLGYDGESDGSMLVVFSPGEPLRGSGTGKKESVAVQRVTGEWEVTFIPTMDNRWGDFRLPAFDGYIGVEAREMRYFTDVSTVNWGSVPNDIYGYGPYMETCDVDSAEDLDAFLSSGMEGAAWRPYVWSWQYGVRDNPGSQGWHGLKSRVDPRFLILDRGAHQIFRTNVYAPEKGRYRLVVEGTAPSRILLDGRMTGAGEVSLSRGWHTLVAAYGNTEKVEFSLVGMRSSSIDRRARSMVMLYPLSAPEPEERGMYDSIVASKWYGTDHMAFDINTDGREWKYQFETAPGTKSMTFSVNGSVREILVDGKRVPYSAVGGQVTIRIGAVNPGTGIVNVTGIPDPGCPGPAFFETPVSMECEGGRMPEGDWTQFGALKYFSGAVRYVKEVTLPDIDGEVILDLGDIDATCEVRVNGAPAGVLIGKPYRADITPFVRKGSNRLEITVRSTLSNHYVTIPSPYKGTPRAGLFGPVEILLKKSAF